MIDARQALHRLREGNRRFSSNASEREILRGSAQLERFADGQHPFAVILGCSDSRVPAEIIFDQGLGTLFVIRVAGNIVAPSQVGSIEFAAERYGSRLVVVLGHSYCGAVAATLEGLGRPERPPSPNLGSIVDRIRPAIEHLLQTEIPHAPEALLALAVRANVQVATHQLRHGSDVLARLIEREGLLVVGADYSLKTGIVEFFDGVPDAL